MDNEPDTEETARRLRAAIAYVGMNQAQAAKAMGVSVPTLARMLGRKGLDGIRPATWGELWRAADALGLPRAWFVFDPGRLQDIVPDGMPSFPNDTGSRFTAVKRSAAERNAAAAREEQALRREATRSRERPPGAPRTKREQRHHRREAD